MNPAMRSWNAIMAVSLLAMVGLTLYDRLTPMPKFSVSERAKAERVADIRRDRYGLDAKNTELEKEIQSMLWDGLPEVIGTKALGVVNLAARERLVKVMAFRPQKPLEEGKYEILPYQVSLEGNYEAIINLVNDLEAPGNRFVVQSVQMTSADGNSSNVKASVGIWAVRNPKAKSAQPAPIPDEKEPKVSAEDVSKVSDEKT